MTVAGPESADTTLSTGQAIELLVGLLKRLFVGNIQRMKETPLMRRFEKDLFDVLSRLEGDPGGNVDDLSPAVQRLVYEMVTQYIMMYAQSPSLSLAVSVQVEMSDEEMVSALLREEIIPHSWPYPQSVPL